MAALDGFDDPSDFSTVQLSTLDENLRCPICKELFDSTMILSSCSHSFCALCIRRSLSAEQICPKCRKPAYENNLIHNYDLDNVVSVWKDSRSFLLSLDKSTTAPPALDQLKINTQESASSSHPKHIVVDDDPSDDNFQPNTTTSTRSVSSSDIPNNTTRRSTRLSSQATTQSYSTDTSQTNTSAEHLPSSTNHSTTEHVPLKNNSIVNCPVCEQFMKFSVLHAHIDRCLKGDSRLLPSPTLQPSTTGVSSSILTPSTFSLPSSSHISRKTVNLGKKPVKQVYALMKDKDLTNCLRSLNLPEHGDRAQKIWRHKEYVNLYNANHDSQHPVSANVLIQRLQDLEHSMMMDKQNQAKRKAADPVEHQAKYADQFSLLINNVKRNKIEKSPSNTGEGSEGQ